VGKALPGIETDKFFLFGFSGGGQFVHRYAMFHPDRIERAVAGSAGWYTWPDPSLPYPIGTDRGILPRRVEPKICELCGLDLLVFVGEKDIGMGGFLRRYKGYDLLELQGEGRVHRARNWVSAMRQYGAEHDCDFNIELEIFPNIGHRMNMKMRNRAADFLSSN
jgi:pimeloyl-ACP methyl ester carboxylesterase